MIHVLEKHRFPVSIVETLFLAVCLEQWLSVWEMLASECICLFFFFFLSYLDKTNRKQKKIPKTETLFLCF